jgi:ketosteroid isomerase-like protein
MSQENVELMRRAYRAYEREGIAGILPFCDPEIEWKNPASSPNAATFRGHEGVAEWQRLASESFSQLEFEPLRFIEASEGRVVAVCRARVRGRGSDLEMEMPFAHLATWRDGKVVAFEMHTSVDEALEVAGLSE